MMPDTTVIAAPHLKFQFGSVQACSVGRAGPAFAVHDISGAVVKIYLCLYILLTSLSSTFSMSIAGKQQVIIDQVLLVLNEKLNLF